jgi:hypothetical protein
MSAELLLRTKSLASVLFGALNASPLSAGVSLAAGIVPSNTRIAAAVTGYRVFLASMVRSPPGYGSSN